MSDQLQSDGASFQPLQFGKYLLLGRIGKGGMAEVYLARQRGHSRLLAIKVMRKSLMVDESFVEMFIHEGKLAVQLNHDNIVKTFEIGRIAGRHFICMEYLSGVDLNILLRRAKTAGRMPIPHALYIALRIFDGLHYAHGLKDAAGNYLNVVNRDVSPSNVYVSYEGEVKLIDFGIARARSALSSEIGTLKGKVSHMSPEQVRGLPLDRRSDIFSAGIVLHELLTLDRLFRASSDFHLMDQVRQAEVRPPSLTNPRVLPELDAIVLKALHKDPAHRHQTAEEVALALRAILTRYDFAKNELRDFVREVCQEEWAQEQKRIEDCMREDVPASLPDAPLEEDYGEMLELSLGDAAKPAASPRRSKGIYVLLAIALAMLVAAGILALRL
jgi:eukaryotic-like serine/threonine-protein kinase